ncbi:MAG TPA: agmatine deiminase [Candidatus Acetatifactor stercoripullorum]|uniref:Putative agmatine deiminase n=1 Tax=Candidatus Acetatifactor stercoripullorum TaxID=2838414 RepID=A0A9D1R4H8_9FIRM|nr:agmatine deiminase [uncultured Acetatifactor sp.]HIW81109.1 agmatine deiminase [Candidatus Acetatifactor stercoripullorum]
MRIIKDTTPLEDGYRMPGEFEPHQGCIMIFPERPDSWQYGAYAARKAFVKVAEAISFSEPVTVCASAAQYDNARAALPAHIRVVEMSSNDSWARDYAPTFVKNKEGQIRGIDWGFNAWGGLYDGLYFPWDKDNQMARKLCDLFEKDVYDKRDFILEGGSIHVDGEGTCIVTAPCLLSKGRNPQMSREEIEETLRQYLGVSVVIWLPCGIYNDETNEHVDNICAFVRPGEVVLAWTQDKEDVQYEMSNACLAALEQARDARGRSLKVHKLLLPAPVTVTKEECEGLDSCDGEPTRMPGERLAASYVNFYIANKNIVMPGFGDPMDKLAKETLQELFPHRQVIQIYARDILIGGGNIHCITQQIPANI